METSVCDVLPGGRLALDGTLITQYNEYVAPAPGTSITTVETKYNLYDDGGQVLCDLDEYGNITRRYVYAPSTGLGAGSGKHVAMDLPGNKDYMTNGGFEYGNYEYPLTPWGKWAPDGQTSAVNWQIVSDVKRSGTYSAKATAFSATSVQNYAQNVSLPALPFIASCYMKAQDLTGGVYLLIECWTAGYGGFLGNVTSNLKTGTFDWSLISIPVNTLPEGTGAIKVTLQRLNGTGTVWVDDVRCEEGVSRKEDKSYYYHTDYLGSPRVMTDQLGNVIWRQDYYAFGGDYNTSATGNTHKFTGHVKDDATGQYYAKARYFTTSLGRFSQPEPLLKGVPSKAFLVNPQKLNPYVYCGNNPVIHADPDGLDFILLNRSFAAGGRGHNGILIGSEKNGWTYYSKDGKTGGGNIREEFKTMKDYNKEHSKDYNRYSHVKTTAKQDVAMKNYGDTNYNLAYSISEGKTISGKKKENCADLAYGIGQAGGVDINKPKEVVFPFVTITEPNAQFEYVAESENNDHVEPSENDKSKKR